MQTLGQKFSLAVLFIVDVFMVLELNPELGA
jgi:hypothetical protein